MKWDYDQERCVRKFAWHPIRVEAYGGAQYRWMQTVYIRQRFLTTLFCIPFYENKEFISKEEYEHYVKFGW